MNLYEERLAEVFPRIAEIVTAHPEHDVRPGAKRCQVDDRCDDLGNLVGDLIDEIAPPEDAELFLADGPEDLLDWYSDVSVDTPRTAISEALRTDAWERLFPDHALIPQDPAATRPEGATTP